MVTLTDAYVFDKEIEEVVENFPNLTDIYIPIERIGEGTFSVVYKAIDVKYHVSDNSSWMHASMQDPDDFVLFDISLVQKLTPKTKLQCILKNYFINILPKNQKPHFVALKRINTTSSPDRIKDELMFLKLLK